jgi:acyl-coenzyme A synthetase/AMP-(fatty) acid ligase
VPCPGAFAAATPDEPALVVAGCPTAGTEPSDAPDAELLGRARPRPAHHTCPASVDVVPQLPRRPTGKLRRHVLRRQYRPAAAR